MFELNKILVFRLIVLKDNLTTEEELHCLQCRDMTLRRIDIDNLIKIRSPHLLPIFYRCFVVAAFPRGDYKTPRKAFPRGDYKAPRKALYTYGFHE
jgi:hypothetical protein